MEEGRGRREDRENRKYCRAIGARVVLHDATGFVPRARGKGGRRRWWRRGLVVTAAGWKENKLAVYDYGYI